MVVLDDSSQSLLEVMRITSTRFTYIDLSVSQSLRRISRAIWMNCVMCTDAKMLLFGGCLCNFFLYVPNTIQNFFLAIFISIYHTQNRIVRANAHFKHLLFKYIRNICIFIINICINKRKCNLYFNHDSIRL